MTPNTVSLVRLVALFTIAVQPAVAGGQVSIPRERLSRPQREALLRGDVVRQSATVRDTVAPQASAVVLRPNEVLMARTRAPYLETVVPKTDTGTRGGPVSGQDSVYNLGIEVIGLIEGTQQPVTYKPVFIRHGAAYYSPESSRYEGHFSVAVIDGSGRDYRLATPLRMTFGGDPESYDPPGVSVTGAGDPPSRIRLLSRTARDSVAIRIFMGSDPDGIPFAIPVQATLHIGGPTKVEGFGVDVAKYQIRVVGPGGPGTEVGVVTSRGSLDKDEIRLGASGTGNVLLTSGDGLGSVTLTATAPSMGTEPFDLTFGFPFLFLGFMLAGGATGALFAESQMKRRRGTRATYRKFLGAVLGGIVATVAYVGLGINLLQVDVSAPLANEVAVFAFAALGAWMGVRVAAGGESPATPRGARRPT